MKMMWQRIKQTIGQQPLKYGAVLVTVVGLVIVGVLRQLPTTEHGSDLAAVSTSTKQVEPDHQQTAVASAAKNDINETANQTAASVSRPPVKYYVEIKGEVAQPNVYQVAEDARINDLVKLAGGLTKAADQRQLNLAQPVQDGMSIYVPKRGEELLLQAQSSAPATLADHQTAARETGVKNKVNLNQADVTQLQQVSGIGPKKAADIIAYREKDGPFTSVDDLIKVSGIGEKTLANIRDQLCI